MYHKTVGICFKIPLYLLQVRKLETQLNLFAFSNTKKQCLPERLSLLPRTKSKELPSGEVTSLLDAKVLRQLVRVYLTSNPPKTAKDFNYQAELKAVSHWRWLKDGAEADLVPGPHHDQRLKEAANFVLEKWEKELNERQKKVQQPPSKKRKLDTDHEDESRSDGDIISGIYRIKQLS